MRKERGKDKAKKRKNSKGKKGNRRMGNMG